ncbi:MAG: hypothetical protein ABH807_01970 [Candidatus Shapirobacteria bacterium]
MIFRKVLFLLFLWSAPAIFVYLVGPQTLLVIGLFLFVLFSALFFTLLILTQKLHHALLLSFYLVAILLLRLNQAATPLHLLLLTCAVFGSEIYIILDKK